MIRPKYRNIIPNEQDEKKSKDKSTYSETYEIGGMDSKVKFIIKSLYTEKSTFEIHGNFLYQIKNASHFEIESELNFSESSHIRTQEKDTFEPNKKIFKSYIEPFKDTYKSLLTENKQEEEEDGICKVQYNKGYKVKTLIKLAFTFPSAEKQKNYVKDGHNNILENLKIWQKFSPAQIEQLLISVKELDNKNSRSYFNNMDYNNNDSVPYNTATFLNKSGNFKSSRIDGSTVERMRNYIPSCEIIREFAQVNKLVENNLLSKKNPNENMNNLNKIASGAIYIGNEHSSAGKKNYNFNNNFNNISNSSMSKNNNNNNIPIDDAMFKNNNNNVNNSLNNNENNSPPFFFVDQSFPPCQEDSRIIDLSKEIKLTQKVENTETLPEQKKTVIFHYRPIEDLIPDQKVIFNKDNINPYNIRSGIFKNQNVISVFSHLAAHPRLLSKLFVDNAINDLGIYKVKLFYQNYWSPVFLDKFIPCFPMYFPLYTYSPTALWPCLLEKALAKLFRGYEKLKYISYFELYKILTGFPIYNFKRLYKEISNDDYNTMYEMLKERENLYELSKYTSNFRYVVNSNYKDNGAVEIVNKDTIINIYLNSLGENGDTKDINVNNLYSIINNVHNNTSSSSSDNSYLMAFYTSKSYIKYLRSIPNFHKSKLKFIENRLFSVKEANDKTVIIKSIYNYQLKQYLQYYFSDDNQLLRDYDQNKENDSLVLTWDILLVIFDNIIIIKSQNYKELHFRNGFIRCQDVLSPDYDRILANAYYELTITKNTKIEIDPINRKISNTNDQPKQKESHKKNRDTKKILSTSVSEDVQKFFTYTEKINTNNNINNSSQFDNSKKNLINMNNYNKETEKTKTYKRDLIPVTISLNLSNDHFLDSSYYSPEMDLKIGVFKHIEKKKQNNEFIPKAPIIRSEPKRALFLDDPDTEPILITSPDFQICYSLVYDLYLEEGSYIIVPMTMGYCMQKNNSIRQKCYSLRDERNIPLPTYKTVIPKFLDDIFYMNDPFGKNVLDCRIINQISQNFLDIKGRKLNKIDEESLSNNFSKIGDFQLSKNNFGLSQLSFKEYIFELMTLLSEKKKKQCMNNIGYEDSTYPFLGRFFGISFHFGKFKSSKKNNETIEVTPMNNLTDNNMDKFINSRVLEKNAYQIKDIQKGDYEPKRVFYNCRGDPWYTVEGAYLRKNKKDEGYKDKKEFEFDNSIYEGRKDKNYFYSTHENRINSMIHSGNFKFLLYVVDDVLSESQKKNNRNNFSVENSQVGSNGDDEEEDNEGKSFNSEFSDKINNKMENSLYSEK